LRRTANVTREDSRRTGRGWALRACAGVLLSLVSVSPVHAKGADDPAPRPGVPAPTTANAAPGTSPANANANANAAPTATDPDAPTVAAKLDAKDAHVGDALPLVVTVTSHVPVNLPTTLELGPFSLLDRKEEEKDLGGGRRQRVFTLAVAAYEPGDLTVPPVAVTYIGRGGEVRVVETEPLPVHVASLLANEPEPALKENAAAVTVWQEDWRLVYVAGALFAAGLGALVTWLVVRKLRQRVVVRPGPPPRPAHEIALEKLDRLGSYGLFENADNRPFYFALSEIIREYFGNRYGFDSLELTTDELVAELRRHAGKELVLGEIEGWLSGCDLVKFAKISPSAAEARAVMEVAIRIVETTKQRPEPQATAAEARAAAQEVGGPGKPDERAGRSA
jgi:hypothetical protein